MSISKLPIICLTGPTATGKSQLAIELTQLYPCDIISVDSVMVYRGMNIGTSKPSNALLNCIPHHLIDIREPTDPYSVGDFFRDAQQLIKNSLNKERIPLLVGGTMLYFNAIRQGLADLPTSRNSAMYPIVKNKLATLDLPALYNCLKEHDPDTAKRLHQNDRQRVERALLVYYLSNKPLSQLQRSTHSTISNPIIWIALYPDNREQLRKKIATRFKEMLSEGFIAEAKSLYERVAHIEHLPAYRAVGYRQAWDHLAGKTCFKTFEERSVTATWQLAKHQFTWLRRWPELTHFNMYTPSLLSVIQKHINSKLVVN